MKTLLANLWNRRWCRLLLAVTTLCALTLLHPFVRQSIFGPMIDGIPWCVWEEEVRRDAHPELRGLPRSWFYRQMEAIGVLKRQPDMGAGDLGGTVTLPLYLHLVNDGDVNVRRYALRRLANRPNPSGAEVLSICRQRLVDDDPEIRLFAAHGIWRATKEPEAQRIILGMLDDSDSALRWRTAKVLRSMAPEAPDLFEPLAKLTEDSESLVRHTAVWSMAHFGQRGLPILQTAYRDSDKGIRYIAVVATGQLKKDAEPLIPVLISLQADSDPQFRAAVTHALELIDPKRFAKPANPGE
jgi:hypothetical protein